MRSAPVPTPGRTCASEPAPIDEVVLAGEAERLVVVGLEQEAGVVDLEDVDLAEVPVERGRVGDRVHAVEGMGQVDEPALLADRGDGVGERHAARDLLAQEEADHLALAAGLDLLAGDHDHAAAARALGRLESAAEDVVVGDGDRAEPFRLGVVEQLVHLDRAVVRPVRVHVQVGDDPLAAGERVRLPAVHPAAAGEAAVEPVQLGGDAGEALVLGERPRVPGPSGPQLVVLGQPRDRRGCELGLLGESGRVGDRDAGGGGLEAETRPRRRARGRRSPPRRERRPALRRRAR